MSVLQSDVDPAGLSRRTLEAVRAVVDCDFITFDSFGGDGQYIDTRWNSDDSILTPELLNEFGRLFNASPAEHPLSHLLTERPFKIEKFSDFVTTREFKKTAIYNEFFRLIDILHQTAFVVTTDTGAAITCAINRLKPDFNERERLLLQLLAPQLAASIRTSIELRKMNERQCLYDGALAKLARAIVGVTRNGNISFASEFGERLIVKYFGESGTGKTLPQQLADWIPSASASSRPEALSTPHFICRAGGSQLRIDLLSTEQQGVFSLLLFESSNLDPGLLRELGLTNREAEILNWVAQGKNDEIIALLCNISTRTVNKHLEHIYRKLGVESRLSAIQFARELLINR